MPRPPPRLLLLLPPSFTRRRRPLPPSLLLHHFFHPRRHPLSPARSFFTVHTTSSSVHERPIVDDPSNWSFDRSQARHRRQSLSSSRASEQAVDFSAPTIDRPLTPSRRRCRFFFCHLQTGIRELTLKFSGPTTSLFGDSSLYLRSVTASCSLCAIICNELFTDRHRCSDVLCIVVVLVGYVVNWNCKGTARGRPMSGKRDAFCRLTYDVSLCFCVLMAKTILTTRQGNAAKERCTQGWSRRPRKGSRTCSTLGVACNPSHRPGCASYSRRPHCYEAEVQGFDYADAGAAAACPASSCSSSSCAPSRARSVVGRGQALEGFQECPEDRKVQCAVFMLTDRGTASWETTERILEGDVGQITWQQFKESFYAKFFSV
ncbi:gag-protease polyprotein [Cucumis melo var. makuwa]|uniref:Gag-protease polyprotein n=1 Tax=Cucumis melo var. makuwa TaxID=1194695 RepID=A0A5D3DFU2_CUCMM|nr:gag-protease polyprotein [Cucumis melo var. makuwa]